MLYIYHSQLSNVRPQLWISLKTRPEYLPDPRDLFLTPSESGDDEGQRHLWSWPLRLTGEHREQESSQGPNIHTEAGISQLKDCSN